MATKVLMEALSPTMEEGQLVQWLKSEGDEIANGDILAEIETDKATMELVARGDGILRKIFLDAGGTAAVGEVIGVIASPEEDISGIEGVSGGVTEVEEPPSVVLPRILSDDRALHGDRPADLLLARDPRRSFPRSRLEHFEERRVADQRRLDQLRFAVG